MEFDSETNLKPNSTSEMDKDWELSYPTEWLFTEEQLLVLADDLENWQEESQLEIQEEKFIAFPLMLKDSISRIKDNMNFE